MILSKKLFLFGFQLALFCATDISASRLRSSRTTAEDGLITCRIFMRSMLYETETNEIRSKVETFCGLVEDGLETYETHLVVLPEDILSTYRNEIQVGALFLSIQNAVVIDDKVVVQQDSQVAILNQVKIDGRGRRLAALPSQTTGTRILKVYRVLGSSNTANDPPALADIEAAVFGNTVSVKTQYFACSNGLLNFTNANAQAETVRIDRGIDTFTRYDDVVQYTLQFLNLNSVADIADNAIFAVPLLTNPAAQTGFIGQGDVLGRVSIFNSKWAGDHATLMHEIGHNFGLVHAGTPSDDFPLALYGDPTTFMGATQNQAIPNGPQRCLNAYHMTYMKWFNSPTRTMSFDPAVQGPRKISVAAFEHTAKATSSQPNIVIVKNQFYMLYNFGVDYNKGTGYKGGSTIVSFGQQFNQGRTRIEGVMGTNPNFATTSKIIGGVHFNLCSVEAPTTETAATMTIGISMDGTGCNAPAVPVPAPVPAPRPVPAPVPHPAPVPVPAPRPAPVPVPVPRPAPVPVPAPRPAPVPVPAPVPAPRPVPAPVPAPRPVPAPVPAPRPAPVPVPAPVPAPVPSPQPIDLSIVDPTLPGPIETVGSRTLKVFRVVGQEPTANDPSSIETLETVIFLSPKASVMQQYRKCSNDQFFWEDAGIENIILDVSISTFLTNADMQIHILTHLRNMGRFSTKLEEIADNVLLAVPKLTNPAASELELSFHGQGYQQRRLSMFSGKWSTDFTTVMQQLGHNLGMIDAASLLEGGEDSTTFMGALPKTKAKSNGPLQCVNGYGAWGAKWFNNRTMSFNPKGGARKIGLAAMVHCKWAEGSTPVILVVTGDRRKKLYVTYNVRFGHIKKLGDYEDSVTIVTKETSGGQERTMLQAKLDANQTSANVAGVSFQVCGFVDAVFQESPAQMVIGISRDGTGCNMPLFTGPLDNP